MNKLVIGLITGLGLGAAGGSIVTYFICKKKFDKELVEARQKYKEYYEKKETEEEEAKLNHVKVVPDKPVETKEYTDIVRNYVPVENRENDIERLVEETESVEKMHKALSEAHDKPKILTIDSFGEIATFDTEALTYYVYDMTLTHEDGTIVDDEAYLLGDALDRYGWRDDDENEDAIYVRNYDIQKDFEVIKVFDEYPES